MAPTTPNTYEDTCKSILWTKTVRIHCQLAAVCGIVAWFLCTVYTLPSLVLSVGNCVRISAYAFCLWAGSVVPVLILRKWQLTTTRSAPRSIIATLYSPSYRWTLLAYLFSALTFALVNTRILYDPAFGRDPDGHFLLYSRRITVINERPVFFAHTFASLAVVYAVLQLLGSRSAVRWQSQEVSTMRAEANLSLRLAETLAPTLRLAGVHSVVFFFVYWLFIREVEIRFITWLLPISLLKRSAKYAAFHSPASLSLLIYKLPLPSATLSLLWEFANTFFDVYTARPLPPPNHKPLTNKLMFEGLRSKDQYFQHHAWLEFSVLARTSDVAKKAFFDDLSPEYAAALSPGTVNPKSGLWGAIARHGLLLLGEDYARLKRRGKPPPAPAPAPAPVAQSTPLILNPHVHTLKPLPATSALLPLPKPDPVTSSLNTIASIHPPAYVAYSINTYVASPINTFVASPIKSVVHSASQTEVVKDVAKGWGVLGVWLGRVGSIVGLGPPPPHALTADDVLPRRDLDIWIADSLSQLIASAPQLDKYGLSQRTTPQILEALVLFELELEVFVTELREAGLKAEEKRNKEREGRGALDPVAVARWMWAFVGWYGQGFEEDGYMAGLEATVDVLTTFKEAISRILRAYGENVGAFKFPPRIAKKLQMFADYV